MLDGATSLIGSRDAEMYVPPCNNVLHCRLPQYVPSRQPSTLTTYHNASPLVYSAPDLPLASPSWSALAIFHPLTESRPRSKAARSLLRGLRRFVGWKQSFRRTNNPATAPVSNLDLPRIDLTSDQDLNHLSGSSKLLQAASNP